MHFYHTDNNNDIQKYMQSAADKLIPRPAIFSATLE